MSSQSIPSEINVKPTFKWRLFGILLGMVAFGLGAVFLTRFGVRRFILEISEAHLST